MTKDSALRLSYNHSGSCGQMDRKFGAFAYFAGNFHAAMMGFDEGFDQIQAQPKPPLRTALVASVEPVPNFALLFQRYAHARVAEFDGDFGGIGLAANIDPATLVG